jgi:hypothetical protein
MTAPTLILPERSHTMASDLRTVVGAEKVKDDYSTLTAYAVDASIYRMAPQAVVLVESEEDIVATVCYAVQLGIPLTPRAAGTNLTGRRLGPDHSTSAPESGSGAESRRAMGSGPAGDRSSGTQQAVGAR